MINYIVIDAEMFTFHLHSASIDLSLLFWFLCLFQCWNDKNLFTNKTVYTLAFDPNYNKISSIHDADWKSKICTFKEILCFLQWVINEK